MDTSSEFPTLRVVSHPLVQHKLTILRDRATPTKIFKELVEEIADLGIGAKKAVKSNLVVVLLHLLKHQFQIRRRSRSWHASIVEHRQRLRDDFRASPSLRGYARTVFEEAYADARARAIVQTGLSERVFPRTSPYTCEQALDPDFLPD